MPGELRIGISGWNYKPWRGVFFPPRWPQKRELEFASRQVNSIEVNGSFYSLQRPESYQAWYEATPPGFLFSIKAGRFITHLKRLKNVEVRAPHDAMSLAHHLGIGAAPERPPDAAAIAEVARTHWPEIATRWRRR